MDFLKKYWGLPVVLILSIFSILPLLNSGFFLMHDDTQVARVFEMGKALKDGVFPVRWVPDLGYGYGYPIFNFYAPLSYYVGGFFNVAGFDALVSTKIMMVIGILLSGIFMYLLSREFWGEIGGLISGLFYIYAPYHAVDIYIRGDVAEFYAYAFIPLAFLGFYKVFKSSVNTCHAELDSASRAKPSQTWRNEIPKSPKGISTTRVLPSSKGRPLSLAAQVRDDNKKPILNYKWFVVGSIGFAGVILSHNLTAMMVTPFILIVILLNCYIAYKGKKYLSMFYVLCSMFLGILLSAFYWLPALMEMKYTNVLSQIGGGADFRDHFVCVQQLWNSGWGFGGSTRGCIDGMSFKLGKLNILLSVISLVLIALIILKNKLFDHSHYSVRIIATLLSLFGLLISVFLMLEISKPVWEAIPFMEFFQYPWRFLLASSFFSSFLAGSVIWFFSRFWTHEQSSFAKMTPLLTSFLVIFFLIFLNAKLFNPQAIISRTAADYTSDHALKWEASKLSDEYLPKDFVKPKSFSETQKNNTYSKNYPEQTFIQKSANFLSLAGVAVLILGIIYYRRRSYKCPPSLHYTELRRISL